MTTKPQNPVAGRSTAILIGGSMLAVMTIALAKEFGGLDNDTAKRAIGLIFGVILMSVGNILPKIVLPLEADWQNPTKARAAERFAGRMFVLAGLVYISVWLFAATDSRMIISSLVGLSAFGIVGIRWALLMRGQLSREGGSFKSDYRRIGIFCILHALLWVFAMFLVDSVWGDSASQWMVIIFVLVNGLLVSLLFKAPPSNE